MLPKTPKLAQNGQKSCFSSHHLKSSNGFCWPKSKMSHVTPFEIIEWVLLTKSKMSHVTVKEMNIMSFVFDAFFTVLATFWAIFYLRAGSWSKLLSKKVIFYDFTQKSSFFDKFFINCCKIGNVHKNNIEKHPKNHRFYCVSTHFLLCFNPFLLCFNPFLRLFFDEKQDSGRPKSPKNNTKHHKNGHFYDEHSVKEPEVVKKHSVKM